MNWPTFLSSILLASTLAAQGIPKKPEERTYPITVSGRGLDDAGKPVEGATIFLVSLNGVERELGETKTDASGHYQFENVKLPVPQYDDKDAFVAGTFQVFGKASGRAFTWRGMRSLCVDPRFLGPEGKLSDKQRETGYLPGEKIELDLTFARPYPITGRFVDEKGHPISKVRVDLGSCDFIDKTGKESHVNYREFWGLRQARKLMPEQVFAISDADGRFSLSQVPPGQICWLLIEHPDYARVTQYAATVDSPPSVDGHPVEGLPLKIKLLSVRIVPVQVSYFDTGKPAAGAYVSAYQSRDSGTSAGGKADENGRVVLKLPPGKYELGASPPADSDYIQTVDQLIVEDQPAEQPAKLSLDSGCVLVFKAVDAETGKGVSGISFWCEVEGGGRTGVQTNAMYVSRPKTDKNGEMRAVVTPGKHQYGLGFYVLPDGYRADNPEDGSKGREVVCLAGKKVVVEFKVRR